MNWAYLVILVAAGIVAGWLAGLVTKGRGFGLSGNILCAVAGAFVGAFVLDTLGIGMELGLGATVLAGLIGAFALLAIIAQMRN